MSNILLNADSTTLILNGRAFSDFVDGDTVVLTPVNPLTSHTRSRDSVNINKRSDALVYDLVFRIPKYSDDDDFMLAQLNNPSIILFNGSCKENYVKDGEDRIRTATLQDGSVTTQPTDTRNSTDGNNLREYTIRFNKVLFA